MRQMIVVPITGTTVKDIVWTVEIAELSKPFTHIFEENWCSGQQIPVEEPLYRKQKHSFIRLDAFSKVISELPTVTLKMTEWFEFVQTICNLTKTANMYKNWSCKGDCPMKHIYIRRKNKERYYECYLMSSKVAVRCFLCRKKKSLMILAE